MRSPCTSAFGSLGDVCQGADLDVEQTLVFLEPLVQLRELLDCHPDEVVCSVDHSSSNAELLTLSLGRAEAQAGEALATEPTQQTK